MTVRLYSFILKVYLIVSLGVIEHAAIATDPPRTPAPDLSPAPPYAAVCSDVDGLRKKTEEELKALGLSEPLRQRISYCNSAKMAILTRDFAWAIAGAQSAATVVCTSSCISGFTPLTVFTFGLSKAAIDRVCTGVSIASNATELGLNAALQAEAKTQFEVGRYIMPALGIVKEGGKLISDVANNSKDAATHAPGTMEKIEACAGAAMLAFQAANSYSEVARQNAPDGPIQNNLRSAAAQISQERKNGITGNQPGSFYASNNPGTQAIGTAQSQPASLTSGDQNACAGAAQNFSATTVATCSAAAVGMDVPQAYLSGEFRDTFNKLTGQDLAGYIKNGPADYAATLSRPLNQEFGAEKAARLSDGVRKFQSDVGHYAQTVSSQYFASSSGARARGGHSSASDSFAGIADLMKGLMPGGAVGAKDAGPTAAGQKYNTGAVSARMPATAADGDPAVSLFDRVSDAYRVAGHKTGIDQASQWALPVNRASHGLR